MWEIISDGLDGFLLKPYDPLGDALGGGFVFLTEAIVVFILGWVAWAMGDLLMLPLACLVLLLIVGLLVGAYLKEGASQVGFVLFVCPVVMYAWCCLCWGMFGATAGTGKDYVSFFAWILAGIGMFCLCSVVGAEMTDGMLFPGLLVFAQLAIWWAALATQSMPATTAQVLKYTFRLLGICSVVGLLTCLIGTAVGKGKGRPVTTEGVVSDAVGIALGVLPLLVCGLMGHVLVSWIGALLMVGCYVLVGLLASRLPIAVRIPSLGALVQAYLVFFFCYLMTRADLSCLPPVDAANAVVGALRANGLVQVMGSAFESSSASFAQLFEGVLRLVLSLVMRIFDQAAPNVAINTAVAGVLSFAPITWAASMGHALALRMPM